MNFLSSVITYVRRLVKTPSGNSLTDNLIIDYINRFWIMDVDARMQLFDLKTTYQFVTQPGVDRYNMPLYSVQSETPNVPNSPDIGMYPVYQGFLSPAFIDGIEVAFFTEKDPFENVWPNYTQTLIQASTGDGSNGPYTLNLPFVSAFNNTINFPYTSGLIRGHVDLLGIMSTGLNVDPPIVTNALNYITTIPTTSVFPAVYFTSTDNTGANVVISDSGEFLQEFVNNGLLMQPGKAPYGNLPLPNGYTSTQNTINYVTGIAENVYFPVNIPDGMPINSSAIFFELGIPRSILYYNNTLTLRAPPQTQYIVTIEAYLSPAAFFNTAAAIPFAYMAEYIARGAARKILSDTGDWEQFDRYEPLFIEQERLVWKRSQRQFTATRTQTIYSQGNSQGGSSNNFGVGNL